MPVTDLNSPLLCISHPAGAAAELCVSLSLPQPACQPAWRKRKNSSSDCIRTAPLETARRENHQPQMPVHPSASGIGLHMAAMCGDVRVVCSLLESKDPATDIESRDTLGDSGLLKASRYGHLEVNDGTNFLRLFF